MAAPQCLYFRLCIFGHQSGYSRNEIKIRLGASFGMICSFRIVCSQWCLSLFSLPSLLWFALRALICSFFEVGLGRAIWTVIFTTPVPDSGSERGDPCFEKIVAPT